MTTLDTSTIIYTADEVAAASEYAFIDTSQTLTSAFELGLRVILSDPIFFISCVSLMAFFTMLFALINYFRGGL